MTFSRFTELRLISNRSMFLLGNIVFLYQNVIYVEQQFKESIFVHFLFFGTFEYLCDYDACIYPVKRIHVEKNYTFPVWNYLTC